MENFAKEMIRGITKDEFIEGGHVLAGAFEFNKNNDRFEASINWYDDDGAIEIAMNQRKKDSEEIQFKAGLAILSTDLVRKIDYICFERAPIDDNEYHGNLYYTNLSNSLKKLLYGQLSMAVQRIIPRE